MAELTLPQNSKVQKGKEYPLEDGCENKKGFSIYRWSPDDDENPRTDYYEIDLSNFIYKSRDNIQLVCKKL